MRTILAITGSLLLVAFGLTDAAWAQIPRYMAGPQTGGGGPTLKRSTRPVVSPYTGLLGAGVGSNSGIGYQFFTRVQPQIAAGRAIGSLGNSVSRLQATQSLASGGLSNLSTRTAIRLAAAGPHLGNWAHRPSGVLHDAKRLFPNEQAERRGRLDGRRFLGPRQWHFGHSAYPRAAMMLVER